MQLPADFALLSIPEQLFVAIDRERVDRGLAPFVGLSTALGRNAASGARHARLPSESRSAYRAADSEWIGDVANGLDADYQWMYDDGPGSGLQGCSMKRPSGCWVDRHIMLDRLGGATDLVMGAAFDPVGDTSSGDRGGTSLAASLAAAKKPPRSYAYTWAQAVADTSFGQLAPLGAIPANESDTGIPDPADNVAPVPDYLNVCASSGRDNSLPCTQAVLAAINHARTLEGVTPMVLPSNFTELSVPEQLFVAVDLERVDRGLSPFVGMTAGLDANARRGAADANDPPDPGRGYLLFDGEWAGGSVNALDAVYGLMYDDGLNSGNLDCPHAGAVGCWGHRHGILDDFGSSDRVVLGAAWERTADTHTGDKGGTSMAVTLAVVSSKQRFVFTWAETLAHLPGSSPHVHRGLPDTAVVSG